MSRPGTAEALPWLATRLLQWFDLHGRKNLPWQQDIDPYRVWVSEIMLQQTQVSTVVPYYLRFMARFPDVATLATADLDEVLHYWTGLGYYARGRNLHKAASAVMRDHAGAFPGDPETLAELPGIGRSTAAAIAAIAFGRRAAILDGNVKRVLARFHAVAGYPGDPAPLKVLWQHAENHTPRERVADYTQAIMDLGATLCTRARPRCDACPLAERCSALALGTVSRLPERKLRRDKPVRAARMFVITDPDGHCLLERRPEQGLWGGLWTPPEREADATLATLCQHYGFDAGDVETCEHAPVFRHTFSHFHLDIEPVYVTLNRSVTAVAEGVAVCWYAPADGAGRPPLGLSAPAAKLLSGSKPAEREAPS